MEEREVMLLGMAAAASVEKRRACVHFEREAKTITLCIICIWRRREVEGGLARRNVDVCERGKV